MSAELDRFAETILQELPEQVQTNLHKINEINRKVHTIGRRTDRLIAEYFSPEFPEDKKEERRAYIDSLLAKIRRHANQKVRLSEENFNVVKHSLTRLDTHLNKFEIEVSFRALKIANAPDHHAESKKWQEWDKNKGNSPTKKTTKREFIKSKCTTNSKKWKKSKSARTGNDIKSCKRNEKKRKKNTKCPTNETEDKETISKKQRQESPQPSTSKCDDESNETFKSSTEIRQISKSKKVSSKDAGKRKKGSAICSSSDEEARKSMLKKKQRQESTSTKESKTDQEPSTSGSSNKITSSNKKKNSIKNIFSKKVSNSNTKDTSTKEPEKKESKSEHSSKRTGQDEEAIPEEDFDIPVDPNEPVYCICQRVSFGDMVACDGKKCTIEWFHFECVGLSAPPGGKWYCEECSEKRKKS